MLNHSGDEYAPTFTSATLITIKYLVSFTAFYHKTIHRLAAHTFDSNILQQQNKCHFSKRKQNKKKQTTKKKFLSFSVCKLGFCAIARCNQPKAHKWQAFFHQLYYFNCARRFAKQKENLTIQKISNILIRSTSQSPQCFMNMFSFSLLGVCYFACFFFFRFVSFHSFRLECFIILDFGTTIFFSSASSCS